VLLTGCLAKQNAGTDGGKSDGEVIKLPPAWTPTPVSIPGSGADLGVWHPCGDEGPPSRLELGITVIIKEGMSYSIRLRAQPGISGSESGSIHPNDVLRVVDGPRCLDQLVWWEVQSMATGEMGWAVEGNQYDSWLVRFQ
jgi:hypothetical protein